MAWVRNNWRLGGNTKTKAKVKCSDIVYAKHQHLMDKEIARLLYNNKTTIKTKGWFGKCMVAISNVIATMTSAELKQLNDDIAYAAENGLPEEEQNRYVLLHVCTSTSIHYLWLQMSTQILDKATGLGY